MKTGVRSAVAASQSAAADLAIERFEQRGGVDDSSDDGLVGVARRHDVDDRGSTGQKPLEHPGVRLIAFRAEF